jgi:hypothetical protein
MVGLTFTSKAAPLLYEELLKKYPNTAVYINIHNDKIILDPSFHAATYCLQGENGQAAHSDILTIVLKRKFYSHIVSTVSAIIEALQSQVHNLQKIFLYHMEEVQPLFTGKKPFSDICMSATKLLLTEAPTVHNSANQPFNEFYNTALENSQLINTAFGQLKSKLVNLCSTQDNYPLVKQIYNSLLTMNINLRSYLKSYALKISPGQEYALPQQLPLLFSNRFKESDLTQLIFTLIKSPVAEQELRILLTVIENEKTSAIIFLREFLNNGTDIPKFLHFNLLPKIDTREKPQTTYGIHTEFRNPFPPNNNNRQSYQANDISLNFPVPARPAQHVLSDSTDAPSTNLLQNNTPLNIITLD